MIIIKSILAAFIGIFGRIKSPSWEPIMEPIAIAIA
jgi:hypothetical protein